MSAVDRVLGESPAMAAVRAQVTRLLRSASGPARRPPPILILGETGTGKGLLADAIHRASSRAAGPFVDVNCAAIPETLMEAELFGYERGAFTDARHAKPGLFQAASGGTLFLDEVGLLPPALQSKLLKAIEDRVVRRLGSTRGEPVDAAIIAATSEDLAAAVSAGRFRADLYHRLAVVSLVLPPLRARGDDALLLAEHFLRRACEDYGLPQRALADDARAAIRAHPWPGNVRELGNVLERAALFADGPTIRAADLALPAATDIRTLPRAPLASGSTAAPHLAPAEAPQSAAAGHDVRRDSDPAIENERRELLDALRAAGWNFTRAAARLGLPRNTLRYRVERLGLAPEVPTERRRGGRPPASARPRPADISSSLGGTPAETAGQSAPDAATVAHAGREAAQPPAGSSSVLPASGAAPPSAAEPGRIALVALALVPMPPEGWATSRAIQDSAAKLEHFGGRIVEMSAGALVAAFGLEPDEDAPRMAAHAAVAIRAAARRARARSRDVPDVALAIHTERVGTAGFESAAAADARPALAALLEDAEPGTIVASAAAARFLARRFELIAGASNATWRVVGLAEPRGAQFVGRERELRLLDECFELAAAGRGQAVLIAGEPGIGKSRLVHEFRRRLGRAATWVEGHALAVGRSFPLHPLIDMVRRVMRVEDTDSEAAVVDKLERAVARLGADVAGTLPYLRYLLSIDPGDASVLAMDPRRRHDAIIAATHRLLEHGARLRPHVVVVEDLHWCDPATEDWIARLAARITSLPVLVLLTTRPGYRPPFTASVHTTLALTTLSGADSGRLAASLLGARELPPPVAALVIDKTEGNPFFIEELVRTLEEAGAIRRTEAGVALASELATVAVPDTVQDAILARARRLDDRLRRVLDVAAVIGRTVSFPLLCAVTGAATDELAGDVSRLEAAEFLVETRRFPDVEHAFKHALTQDVAYERIDPAERRALHARIVGAIEALNPDRLGEHVERLAYHAQRGELWPAAVRYARQAGAKAFDRSANREAVAWFEQALAALAHLPPGPSAVAEAIDVRLAVRSALLQLAELGAIRRYLGEAEALAIEAQDRPRLAWVRTYLTITHLFDGNPSEALVVGERALALAEEVGDQGLRASARTPLAHACRELGDYRRAVALFREAIDLLAGGLARARLGQAMPPSFYARSMAAFCLAELGDFTDAARLGGESAAETEALDLPFGLAMARMALGHTAILAGRLDEAVATLERALALIEARGIPTWHPWAAALEGYAIALAGDPDAGVRRLEHAIERATALGFLFGHSQWVAWLAHAHLLGGRPEEARRRAAEALELSRRRREQGYEAWALWVAAEIEAAGGAAAAPVAVAAYREAHALAAKLGMQPLAARCETALERLRHP